MVRRHLLFTFSLALLAGTCFAQSNAADSIVVKRTVIPSLYIDYGKLLTIPSNIETKYEGGIELLFLEKFPLIIEAGQATLTPEGAYSNGTYESSGYYFRVGTGFMNQFTAKNKIGITARYARAIFKEEGRIFIESPSETQDTFVQNIDREDVNATWYEMVLYTDQKLSDMFSIGLNLRFRVLVEYDEFSPVDVYSIPGYGRSFDGTIPAANLFLKVNF
ncbi:DUF6048 family protein [Ekhidna sp.]